MKEDKKISVQFYQAAATQGSALANFTLGACWEVGSGTSHRRLDKARSYYQTAADRGYEPARRALNRLRVLYRAATGDSDAQAELGAARTFDGVFKVAGYVNDLTPALSILARKRNPSF